MIYGEEWCIRNTPFLQENDMAAVSVSAKLDERDAKLVRMLAEREHRTVSNFIANAVVIFSDLPKDLRDSLLELRVDKDAAEFRAVVREMSALVARRKFEMASQRLAEQKVLPELPEDVTDLDILDQASTISRSF
jgi:hypothetical protein